MANPCRELGCGEYRVHITNRCGTREKCEIARSLSALEWGRTMDDTSETKATAQLTGNGAATCCSCLGTTRTWLHSLSVSRDGDLVWFGPVTNLLYKKDTIDIVARDLTAWWDKRRVHNDYDFDNATLRTVVQTLMEDALGPDDPCNILGSINYGSGLDRVRISREVTANEGYLGDIMRDLAQNYLDYTAIGHAIYIDAPLQFGPYTTLTDKDFQVELEVEERGVEGATHWTVTGEGVVGEAGGINPVYGLLEGLASEDTIKTTADANTAAAARLARSNPVPLYLNIPNGARLSPRAPICIDQMVPGVLTKVRLNDTCRPIDYTGLLTAISVNVGDDESVGVTISPPGGSVSA